MKLHTVRLYGKMGAMFGRVHKFALDTGTPAEAMQALLAQNPGMSRYLTNAKDNGVGFAVFIGKKNIGEDLLTFPANDDIRIAPVIMGSKQGGWLQVVVGVILIVVGALTSWAGGEALIVAGIGMVAGGVVQLLTPVPKTAKPGDTAANASNYSFNGPVNTQAQGNPVPLFYGGPLTIGSAVISAGIQAQDADYSPTSAPIGSGFMGGGGGQNVATIRTA